MIGSSTNGCYRTDRPWCRLSLFGGQSAWVPLRSQNWWITGTWKKSWFTGVSSIWWSLENLMKTRCSHLLQNFLWNVSTVSVNTCSSVLLIILLKLLKTLYEIITNNLQGCTWHYKNSLKMPGSRGRIGPGGVKGQRPCEGPKAATPPGRNWIFTLLQLKNWPLLDRSWLKSEGKRELIRTKYKYITHFFAG